jgi:hypothetical protein
LPCRQAIANADVNSPCRLWTSPAEAISAALNTVKVGARDLFAVNPSSAKRISRSMLSHALGDDGEKNIPPLHIAGRQEFRNVVMPHEMQESRETTAPPARLNPR